MIIDIDTNAFADFAVWFVTALDTIASSFINVFRFLYLLPQFIPQPFRSTLLIYIAIYLTILVVKVVRGE